MFIPNEDYIGRGGHIEHWESLWDICHHQMNASMHQRTRGTSSFHALPTYALEQIQCKQSRVVNKINYTSLMCETLAPYYFDKVVSIHKDHTTRTLWYRLHDRCVLNQNTNLKNNKMFLGMHWHTLRLLRKWEKIPLQGLEPYNAFGWWQHHRHRLDLYHKWASLDPRFFVFFNFFCGVASHDCIATDVEISSSYHGMVDLGTREGHQMSYALPPQWGRRWMGNQ